MGVDVAKEAGMAVVQQVGEGKKGRRGRRAAAG